MRGWQNPFTEWDESATVSAEDMNRIGGNLNYLLNGSTRAQIKENWTDNDIVRVSDWKAITDSVTALMLYVKLAGTMPGAECNADNFNIVESRIAELKQPIDLRFRQTGLYLGDGFVGSDYTGGH